MIPLRHVSAPTDHLQGGKLQRNTFIIILSKKCIYEVKYNVIIENVAKNV